MSRPPARPARSWFLADDVHAVVHGEDLVLLDVGADAYLCAPGGGRGLRIDVATGALHGGDATVLDDLRTAGLVTAAAGASARRPPPPPPTGSLVGPCAGAPRWSDLRPALAGGADVLLHYRGRGLSDLLRLTREPPRRGLRPPPPLPHLVSRFHAWVPYAPVSGKCLLRAFMLRRLLRRAGHDALWVFGVTVWPFRAHCWLQCGDLVLDDHVDHLAAFRPILTV